MLGHQLEQTALLLHKLPDAQGPLEKSILLFTLLKGREGVISIHYHCIWLWHTDETALAAQCQSLVVCLSKAAQSLLCREGVCTLGLTGSQPSIHFPPVPVCC